MTGLDVATPASARERILGAAYELFSRRGIREVGTDEVIERANNNPNGLGGSIWSKDLNKAKQLALQLQCGTAWINKHSPVQPNAPFGGVKSSGFGVEFGEEGLAENTDIQVIWS